MKPSITIWPESVAVTVEFRPQHKSAMPNAVAAAAEPSSGVSSFCASPRSAMPYSPALWKVAAARIRIEALTSRASISAIVESMVANLIASRLAGIVSATMRVCTIEECR